MGISDHILIARRERERRALEASRRASEPEPAEPEPEEDVITDLDEWFEQDEPEDEED